VGASLKKKKVLLVTGVFPPGIGGMQSYYYHLCRSSKLDMTVLAPQYEGDAAFDAVPQSYKIIRGPFFRDEKINPGSWLSLLRYTWRTIRQEKIEVTVYGYILIGFIGWLFNLLFGKEYVISTHGKDMMEFRNIIGLRFLTKIILKRATGILTNSEFTRKEVEKYGVDPHRIQLIYPGVEDVYVPEDKDPALVEKHGLAGKYVMMTVGRLVRRKGHDMVIRALPEAVKQIPNLVYLIVGDGPKRDRLEQLAKECGVWDRVVFAGYVEGNDEAKKYYNLCDQFIMTSRLLENKGDVEGFGIVYLEAASCRKAVIAGNSGGVGEAVLHEETGLLVDPESASEIASAIVRLYHNPQLRENLANRAYERAKKSFRYKRLGEQFDTYLANVSRMSVMPAEDIAALKARLRL